MTWILLKAFIGLIRELPDVLRQGSIPSRAEARFVGVPPHVFTSAPSRAIDNAISIPIGRVASVGPMPAAARAASTGSRAAERQKAASALLPCLAAAQ